MGFETDDGYFENEEAYKAFLAEQEQKETIQRAEQKRKEEEEQLYNEVLRGRLHQVADSEVSRASSSQDASPDQEQQPAQTNAAAEQQPKSTFAPTLGSATFGSPETEMPQTGTGDLDNQAVQFTPHTTSNSTTQVPQPNTSFSNQPHMESVSGSYDPNTSPDFVRQAIETPASTIGAATYDPQMASPELQRAVTDADRASFAARNNGGNNGDGQNNGIVGNGEQEASASENQNTDENDPRYYLSEEMLRARHIPQPFWLSDRRKKAWDECIAGVKNAQDPADIAEQMIWAMIDLGPKMYLAYILHNQDQEVAIKNAAQTDREEYDKQLLLMKNMSPIEFSKTKADWVFASEELHKQLKQQIPGIAIDENGFVDWKNCNEAQQEKIKEKTAEFVANPEGPYKELVEKFTRREFGETELSNEGRGMAAMAEHFFNPQYLKRLREKNNGAGPTAPQTPQPLRTPKAPQTKEENQGVNAVLAQAQKGKLRNVQAADFETLLAQGTSAISEFSGAVQKFNSILDKGALINQARNDRPAPQYGAQVTMQNPYDRGHVA